MKGGLIVWADSPLKIDAYRACGRGSSGAARGVGVIRKLSFSVLVLTHSARPLLVQRRSAQRSLQRRPERRRPGE